MSSFQLIVEVVPGRSYGHVRATNTHKFICVEIYDGGSVGLIIEVMSAS